MTICILTDSKGSSYNEHQWKIGEKSASVTHYYSDEYIAIFANPIFENFAPSTMQLWEFVPDKEIEKDALRCGCIAGTVIRSIHIPSMTLFQRVEIAVNCVLFVLCKGEFSVLRREEFEKFREWAEGRTRTEKVVEYNGIASAGALGKAAYEGVSKVVQAAALCVLANDLLRCHSLIDWTNEMAKAAMVLAASSVASVANDSTGGKYLNVSAVIKSVMKN